GGEASGGGGREATGPTSSAGSPRSDRSPPAPRRRRQISSAGSPLLENYVHDGVGAGTSEELSRVLERVLTEARRLTRAEGGTIYVREGNWLRFTVVQNEALARRHGERELPRELLPEPLELNERSIAGFVGLTARELNVPNAYHIPPDRPYKFDANVE